MPNTSYTDFKETDDTQTNIMVFVGWWVRNKKTPIPRNEIILHMKDNKINRGTVEAALHGLIVKGFIRKSYAISNKTAYVMLRSV